MYYIDILKLLNNYIYLLGFFNHESGLPWLVANEETFSFTRLFSPKSNAQFEDYDSHLKESYDLLFYAYFDYLKNTYGLTKTNIFKHNAKAIGSQEREVKGNFNVLNPDSKEDPYTYNSADFVKEVISDYKKLTT